MIINGTISSLGSQLMRRRGGGGGGGTTLPEIIEPISLKRYCGGREFVLIHPPKGQEYQLNLSISPLEQELQITHTLLA